MRKETNLYEDTTLRIVPSVPWRLCDVRPLDSYRLYVKFMDGLEGFVDLSRLITGDHAGVFMVLRDRQFFKDVYLNYGSVAWPGGLDLAPDTMYKEVKNTGEWIVS